MKSLLKFRFFEILSGITFFLLTFIQMPSTAHTQTFPYDAVVCKPEAFARSGPGTDFYATDRLENGVSVQVYQHTQDGWCGIRPPVGSFSYVPARYVQMVENDLGKIVGNSVPVYVGSRVSANYSQIQRTLAQGTMVEVLELPREGDEALCRISPPSGEFRWIHASALTPNRTGITTEPLPQDPQLGTPSGNGSGNLSGSFSDRDHGSSTSSPVPAPGTFMHKVNQLDMDLTAVIAMHSSAANWETESLLMRANRLMNQAQSMQEREALEHVRQKILKADEVRRGRIEYQELLATASEDHPALMYDPMDTRSSPLPDFSDVSEFPAPYSTQPGRWEYSGILVRVQRKRYAHLSLPQYAIVNEDGLLRCYVSPMPGVDLEPHIKKRVALAGSRNYIREQRAFNLNAHTIVNVW